MKLVTAILTPFKWEAARIALSRAGVTGITITELRGSSRHPEPAGSTWVSDSVVHLLPKVRLEVAVANDQVESVIAAIAAGVSARRIGDGKIFVIDLEQVIRIRTGETGAAAL